MLRFLFHLLLFLSPLSLAGAESGKTDLRFEIVVRKDSILGQKVFKAFERVFRKHGLTLSVEEFPSQRGIQELRRGRVDGTVGRVGDLEKLHGIRDYIRLNAPLMVYTVSMWCSKAPNEVMALQKPRVAYFPGNIFAMRTVKLIQDRSVAVSEITSFSNLIKMMQTDRLDCLVASDTILDKVGINPQTLNRYSRQLLIAAPAYPWIARKFSSLVDSLEKELLAEQQEIFLKRWQADWKTSCPMEFNRICPDGRVFTQSVIMPDQDWRSEQPWADN